MKKARTKKSRGLKRKSPQDPAEAREKQAKRQSQAIAKTIAQKIAQKMAPTTSPVNKSIAAQVAKAKVAAQKIAEQKVAAKKVAAKKVAAKNERPAPKNNVLKTRNVPQQTTRSNVSDGATTNAEVDRWISMIREGGLDRKVKVKGKTGALLVR